MLFPGNFTSVLCSQWHMLRLHILVFIQTYGPMLLKPLYQVFYSFGLVMVLYMWAGVQCASVANELLTCPHIQW